MILEITSLSSGLELAVTLLGSLSIHSQWGATNCATN
jgi:hypothetical protein